MAIKTIASRATSSIGEMRFLRDVLNHTAPVTDLPIWPVPSRNSGAGTGMFRCRDRRPIIHPRDRYCRQRPGTSKMGGQIPAETASFRSTTVSAVRGDWMVETEGTKLPTPHAVVIEPG